MSCNNDYDLKNFHANRTELFLIVILTMVRFAKVESLL